MSDRELRAMVLDLLKEVQKRYESATKWNPDDYPKWDKGEYTVTIQNYEIGKYIRMESFI